MKNDVLYKVPLMFQNRVGPNKCDISSWDRIVIFHWKNQGNP